MVTDPVARRQTQIDVAVVEPGPGGSKQAVHLLGEAKWGTVMGLSHLERLTRAREVLTARGMDTSRCQLACFSANGFGDSLRREVSHGAQGEDGVLLIGPDELYGGPSRAPLH
ncbi:hypothetical protein GCM10022384_70640 [Streptomyces marokkonensis]|uniref:Uncharacterized protein n=1 Tax=Streptomyces marokkonensis TaxID=324855 RepID=A0ABP7SZ79_9ACTN